MESKSGGGVGFLGLLAVAFIVLKLMGYIDWRWVWVLSPIWIGLALFIIACAIAAILETKKPWWY